MTDEELKKKCTERAKIFRQAMESCKSSNPMDCIEWFADRIAELKKVNQYFSDSLDKQIEATLKLQQENAELNEKLSEQKQYTAFKCNEFVKKKDVYEKEHFLLTKAKTYLKYFIEILKKLGVDKEPLVIEAEQFLSEVEK